MPRRRRRGRGAKRSSAALRCDRRERRSRNGSATIRDRIVPACGTESCLSRHRRATSAAVDSSERCCGVKEVLLDHRSSAARFCSTAGSSRLLPRPPAGLYGSSDESTPHECARPAVGRRDLDAALARPLRHDRCEADASSHARIPTCHRRLPTLCLLFSTRVRICKR
jgi:hypothetical protein